MLVKEHSKIMDLHIAFIAAKQCSIDLDLPLLFGWTVKEQEHTEEVITACIVLV